MDSNIKDCFDFVLDNYDNGYVFAESSDPNYLYISQLLPIYISSLFPLRNDLLSMGRVGVGQKSRNPWVAIFNKNITTSATKGLYIVYLFKADMSGFYLSLGQGITYYKENYGKQKYKYIKKVAKYFKNEINDNYFDKGDIDLKAPPSTLGFGYQESNIISKFYEKGAYTEEGLINDLKKMMAIYDEIAGVLSEDNYDYSSAIKKILFTEEDAFINASDEIDAIKKAISSPIDVNLTRSLHYVEPKIKGSKKYSKIRDEGVVNKIDYIEKVKGDMEIGLLGEMLALSYEQEKLTREGHPELADKVHSVSIISDAYGYDIISYELINLKYEEIYIEVKTTTNKLDVDFPVSKNEVDTSKNKKDYYCIFRIYDVKSVNPSFYKVFGQIEDHFEINPISYLARYKGK